MSNFKYEMKNGKCYLVVGKNRIRVEWKERYVPESEEIVTIPESITLNKESAKIYINSTPASVQLSATVGPEGASQEVVWASSDKTIATVTDAGLVESKNVGKVNITCSSKVDPTVKAICKITVEDGGE